MTPAEDTFDGSSFDAYLTAHPPTRPSGTLASLSPAADFVLNIGKEIAGLFGKGRNEADRITGYQNQLGAPGGILNTAQILSQDPSHNNVEDLNEIYQVTLAAVVTFYNYIGYPTYPKSQWPDGRASRQAYASINAVAPGILEGVKQLLIAAGGVPTPIPGIVAGNIGSLAGQQGLLSNVGASNDALAALGVAGGSSTMVFAVVAVVVLILVMKGGGS